MTLLALVIVGALLAVHSVELAAKFLSLRSLSPEVPAEFEGVYDPEKYRKAQDYARARTAFDVWGDAYGLVLLLAFWFAGGFNALDLWLRSRGWAPLPTGLAYVGTLLLAQDLLSLPFQLYSTFVIEERFGFNRMTFRTFVLDKVKSYALGALIGGIFLAGILYFLRETGPSAWLYCWAAACFFKFFLAVAAPTLILPLFNKFTPLPEGELRTAIFDYARSVQYPLKNIFVMDGSRRSAKTNAFFTGFGKNKRIALFDTLIQKHSVRELVAVMAHEIGHYKKKHVPKDLVFSVVYYGFIFWLLSVVIRWPALFAAFGMDHPSVYAGLVFFGIVYAPVSFLFSVARLAVSRRHEHEADRYSVETLSDPAPIIQALKTLSVSNLANLTPHPFHVAMTYSHPPILKRIEAIRALSTK